MMHGQKNIKLYHAHAVIYLPLSLFT